MMQARKWASLVFLSWNGIVKALCALHGTSLYSSVECSSLCSLVCIKQSSSWVCIGQCRVAMGAVITIVWWLHQGWNTAVFCLLLVTAQLYTLQCSPLVTVMFYTVHYTWLHKCTLYTTILVFFCHLKYIFSEKWIVVPYTAVQPLIELLYTVHCTLCIVQYFNVQCAL